jgi:phosphatidate cytidylyltransferase
MLKQRIITALLLMVVILAIIFLAPIYLFVIIATIIILGAAWEWSMLAEYKKPLYRLLYVLFIAIVLWGTWYAPIRLILMVNLIWWLIAAFLIFTYSKSTSIFAQNIYARPLMGVFTLAPFWLALIFIRSAENGAVILIFVFSLVWSADVGAYFSGKWWGKTKLIPKVSPNKTWQGLFGGILLTIIVAVIGCIVFNIYPLDWLIVIVLAITVAIFSVIGDLFESMLKRQVKIKDTGNYLPGHGGLLDRMDSLTAAVPVFLLGCLLFGLFS